MPVALLKDTKLTIREIMLYTDRYFKTRFDNYERDILPSRLRITEKKTYVKDRPDTFEEKLEIESWSAPQYLPYIRHTKGNRQLKYKHHYSIVIQLAKDDKGNFSYDSKIRWRVGSFKQWEESPPQKHIKTIYNKTKQKLKKKFTNKQGILNKTLYNNEIKKIKKSAKYLNIGDYNSLNNGINGDFYFRCMYVAHKYGCLYGPITNKGINESILLPFFGKHEIAVLFFLIKKGIIKVN